MTDILAAAAQPRDWADELYRQLHANPELSGMESETAELIAQRLQHDGYDVQRIGGGVVGVLHNGDGPTVLFRADIDGLPVKEASDVEYASTRTMTDAGGVVVPVMHACGHDIHITAGLCAAATMAEHRDAWAGTYVALFQPAEETAAGARAMVADGLVDKIPRPDVAFGQHVLNGPATGSVGTCAGPFFASGDSLRITVHGKGSHGSMPHLGVDAVVLAAAIVMRLQGIVARELAPGRFGVVTVGALQAGTKSNIIPDSAQLLVNIRAYDDATRDHLLASIRRIVTAECQASGSPREPEIELYDDFPITANDPATTQRVHEALVGALGADRVVEAAPLTASEDFSVVPDAFGIPYCYWGLGGFEPGATVANHNPGYVPVMHPTLETGTTAAVAAALAWLDR